MHFLKIIKKAIYSVGVVLLLLTAVLVVTGRFGIGGIRALVVQSGSMEPKIATGSIVITIPEKKYVIGDVVTFRQSGRNNVLVSHRVHSIRKTSNGNEFLTKGDANEDADGESVPSKNVIGKVIFSIPFIGRIVSFAQTQLGFVALIIIPAVVIIYSEVLTMRKQIANYFAKKRERQLIRPFE